MASHLSTLINLTDSEYDVYDLTGNVSEWVADWYQAYPGSDYKSNDFGEKLKVVKGAGW